jgi:protein phosphatase
MLTVEVHALSHIGRVRKGNEDNFLLLDIPGSNVWTSQQDSEQFPVESRHFEVSAEGQVFGVSDGMGGALAGEVASKMAVEGIGNRLLDGDSNRTYAPDLEPDTLIERLYEATLFMNVRINEQSRSDQQFQGMGATFTAAAVSPAGMIDVLQVGDSRAYVIRNSHIKQITKDQSLVQQLIDANQIQPEEAETHPLKNVILQALGAQSEVFPAITRLTPRRDDILLICSDGLSNKLKAEDMLNTVHHNLNNLDNACLELVRLANERGGEDNITVILARLTGNSLAEPAPGEEIEAAGLPLAGFPNDDDHHITPNFT